METVIINTAYITLGQLLKMTSVIGSGGMAKAFLAEVSVYVDGEKEQRRGKKLYPGSIVNIEGHGEFRVIAES